MTFKLCLSLECLKITRTPRGQPCSYFSRMHSCILSSPSVFSCSYTSRNGFQPIDAGKYLADHDKNDSVCPLYLSSAVRPMLQAKVLELPCKLPIFGSLYYTVTLHNLSSSTDPCWLHVCRLPLLEAIAIYAHYCTASKLCTYEARYIIS